MEKYAEAAFQFFKSEGGREEKESSRRFHNPLENIFLPLSVG